MFCRKCGKEIPDGSLFCSHCGCDFRDNTPTNRSHTTDEQVPLVILIKKIVKHKKAVIISLLIAALAIGGFIAYKKHQEKKQAEEEFMNEMNHFMSIVGTYKNSDFTLVLSADNTAKISYGNSSWNKQTCRGYWREKYNSGLIEIELSKALKDIYIGNTNRYYCSTLYFANSTLWESMSAYHSRDINAGEFLIKE